MNACNLNHKHGGTENVARIIAPKLNPLVFHHLWRRAGEWVGVKLFLKKSARGGEKQ